MAGLKTQATTRRGPPQRRQVRTSTANVRFSSSALGSRNGLAAGAGELGAGSGGGGWRGTTSGRRRALGARTPKKRTRLTLGGGDERGQPPEELSGAHQRLASLPLARVEAGAVLPLSDQVNPA